MAHLKEVPARFFGPITLKEAEELVELMLDHDSTKMTLIAFMVGEIDPRQLAYDLQSLMESYSETIKRDQDQSRQEMPCSYEPPEDCL